MLLQKVFLLHIWREYLIFTGNWFFFHRKPSIQVKIIKNAPSHINFNANFDPVSRPQMSEKTTQSGSEYARLADETTYSCIYPLRCVYLNVANSFNTISTCRMLIRKNHSYPFVYVPRFESARMNCVCIVFQQQQQQQRLENAGWKTKMRLVSFVAFIDDKPWESCFIWWCFFFLRDLLILVLNVKFR